MSIFENGKEIAFKQGNFIYPKPFQLENGQVLSHLELAYTTLGKLNSNRDNVVWVCHALTANANPLDWWAGLFDSDKGFCLSRYFVICVNNLGSCYGSMGPTSINPETQTKYGLDFPVFSIRDMVKSLDVFRKSLKLNQIQYLIGGSMGGMQAMEWAISQPDVFKNLVLLATNARHSPWGIALNEAQRMAIEADASFVENGPDAGKKGLEAARAMALLSYRNYDAYQLTQLDEEPKLDAFKAASYQNYQGEKLSKRFDAKSYWLLSKAMDSHHVGRDRGDCSRALATIKAQTLVLGIQSDVLFPIKEQEYLAKYIPFAKLEIINSAFGHDGFLIEVEKIKSIINTKFKL